MFVQRLSSAEIETDVKLIRLLMIQISEHLLKSVCHLVTSHLRLLFTSGCVIIET